MQQSPSLLLMVPVTFISPSLLILCDNFRSLAIIDPEWIVPTSRTHQGIHPQHMPGLLVDVPLSETALLEQCVVGENLLVVVCLCV